MNIGAHPLCLLISAQVLGISKNANKGEVKKAYFALAKKYHPDTSKEPDATKKFQEAKPASKRAQIYLKCAYVCMYVYMYMIVYVCIQASDAYEAIGDDEKRKLYDRYGHAAVDG